MTRNKWMLVALAGAIAMAGSAAAQQHGSDSEAFLTAIREGDGTAANEIASRQGSTVVNYRGYDGSTPLTIAMTARNSVYVGFLLGRGALPDLPDKKGDTALIIAARSGFSDGVKTMIDYHARIDAANRQGETALILAVQGRFPRIVRTLLENGANPDKSDIAAGYSARDYARRDSRNPEMMRMIETVKSTRRAISGPTR